MCITSRPLLLALMATITVASVPAHGQPGVSSSPPNLTFATQAIGTSSPAQTITLTNTGNSTLNISAILVAGPFNGDFLQMNTCPPALQAGAHCPIPVVFAPTGTGSRTASVLVFDDASNSPQSAGLSGVGVGTITNIGSSAYQLLNTRTSANQANFYVYQDQDSGFNHGFPSGFFGNGGPISIDTGCVDDPMDLNVGCFPSNDMTDFDGRRGTVLRVSLGPYAFGDYSGLNIQDLGSNSYDLHQATMVTFDLRSPNGAIVRFGVGGCVTVPIGPIGFLWSPMTITLATDLN